MAYFTLYEMRWHYEKCLKSPVIKTLIPYEMLNTFYNVERLVQRCLDADGSHFLNFLLFSYTSHKSI